MSADPLTGSPPEPPQADAAVPLDSRLVVALVLGQVGMHAAMAGLRLAAPLQALEEGHGAWTVGMLMALFAAAPVASAMHAGRMADRLGYHRPVTLAVGLTVLGTLLAVISTQLEGWAHIGLLCVGAAFAGWGANLGMLAVQRTAGQVARSTTERMRIFSWLGAAPSFANVIGPVTAGLMIDLGGFAAAYALMLALPFVSLWSARRVPREASIRSTEDRASPSPWTLLQVPGFKRLLFVNWLMSTCWDVHAFAVPILGHARGFSASTIGFILGTFTLSVTCVRMVIPMLAHRLEERMVVRAAMLGAGCVFAAYPLAQTPWMMGALSALLGVNLGTVQPMVMVMLHHLTPDDRHGEVLAFRSMVINASGTVMPLLFGAVGVALGAGALFWIVGAAVVLGVWPARRLVPPPR